MPRQKITSGIKLVVATIVLLLILGYAYARVESFLRGPRIIVTSPQDGEAIPLSSYFITAEIERAAHITLNGRQVYTDESGELREEVFFAEGLNVFELAAKDRFGRITKKVLTVIYK
ncbi:MAG: hypothetical protein HYT93_01775 [Parcubacteria group bacterium]|nr:hypothetical protein [Parcubacteria group bacterium]